MQSKKFGTDFTDNAMVYRLQMIMSNGNKNQARN